jgi:hypothetical protein
MPVLEKIFDIARTRRARVVFPEMEDPRVAEACARLRAEGLAEPLALGDPTAAQMAALVEGRGVKEPIARRMLTKPLFRAAAMVAAATKTTPSERISSNCRNTSRTRVSVARCAVARALVARPRNGAARLSQSTRRFQKCAHVERVKGIFPIHATTPVRICQ